MPIGGVECPTARSGSLAASWRADRARHARPACRSRWRAGSNPGSSPALVCRSSMPGGCPLQVVRAIAPPWHRVAAAELRRMRRTYWGLIRDATLDWNNSAEFFGRGVIRGSRTYCQRAAMPIGGGDRLQPRQGSVLTAAPTTTKIGTSRLPAFRTVQFPGPWFSRFAGPCPLTVGLPKNHSGIAEQVSM